MISITDLELLLKIPRETDTELLTEFEAAAVQFIQGETKRYFGPVETVVEYVKGRDHEVLPLRELTATVTSVVEQAYPGDASATTIVEADDDGFVIRGDTVSTLVRKGGDKWYRGMEYVVTYERGYLELDAGPPADVAAPDDIRTAVFLVVAALYNQGKPSAGASAILSEKIGNYSYTKGILGDQLYKNVPALHSIVMRWRRRFV